MIASPIPRRTGRVPAAYRIRPFESSDLAAWTAIQAAADRYNVITPELFHATFGFTGTLHRERILIACDAAGVAVGTAAAWTGDSDRRAMGRLHWVAVLPPHQGRGLGRSLVDQALARFAAFGHSAAYLTTSAARLPAIHLYDSCGFVPCVRNASEREAWRAIARALAQAGRPLTRVV